MAEVFTGLPEPSRELSSRAMRLLDAQARAAGTLMHLHRRQPGMSPSRRSRRLKRVLTSLREQEVRFEGFQNSLLGAVSDQMRHGVVAPPAPGRSYRAVFLLLSHRLPESLWPAMEGVLSRGVTLSGRDVDGHWHQVPLRFSGGSRASFSRKYLERAVALRVVVELGGGRHETFDYEVRHTLSVKPMRRIRSSLRRVRLAYWFGAAWSAMRHVAIGRGASRVAGLRRGGHRGRAFPADSGLRHGVDRETKAS